MGAPVLYVDFHLARRWQDHRCLNLKEDWTSVVSSEPPKVECSFCSGRGVFDDHDYDDDGNEVESSEFENECPECEGTGEV